MPTSASSWTLALGSSPPRWRAENEHWSWDRLPIRSTSARQRYPPSADRSCTGSASSWHRRFQPARPCSLLPTLRSVLVRAVLIQCGPGAALPRSVVALVPPLRVPSYGAPPGCAAPQVAGTFAPGRYGPARRAPWPRVARTQSAATRGTERLPRPQAPTRQTSRQEPGPAKWWTKRNSRPRWPAT